MRKLIPIVLAAVLVLSCSKNTPPVIEYFVAEPDSVFPGDTVTITYRASDADGDGIHYMLGKSSGTWGTDFGSIEPTTWIAPKEPGDHYLTLMIGDLSDQVTDSVLIHVFDTVGFFTDARDGHRYKWVKIGTQIWMAENLAYLPEVFPPSEMSRQDRRFYVYGYFGTNISDAKQSHNYLSYGALYNHSGASYDLQAGVYNHKGSCPDGWHLPGDDEWLRVIQFLGGFSVAGAKMKESGNAHWAEPNSKATNESGFSALGGGKLWYPGEFILINYNATFWSYSSSENCANAAILFRDGSEIFWGVFFREVGHYVRCVKNE